MSFNPGIRAVPQPKAYIDAAGMCDRTTYAKKNTNEICIRLGQNQQQEKCISLKKPNEEITDFIYQEEAGCKEIIPDPTYEDGITGKVLEKIFGIKLE